MDKHVKGTNKIDSYLREQGFSSATEITEANIPESNWIIKGWVSSGELVVLGGRPKTGKSLLSTQMALSVATGTEFLFKYPVTQGRVLFYDLDDRNKRRLQDRLTDLSTKESDQENLWYSYSLPAADEGGITALDQHLTKCAELGAPASFIIIDCLLAFLGKSTDKNIVKSDRKCLEPLRDLAHKHNVGIVLIHHSRKGSKLTEGYAALDSLIGTTGFGSVIDTGIVIQNSCTERKTVEFDSRDPLTPTGLVLEKDRQGLTGWKVVTEKCSEEGKAMGRVPAAILDVLTSRGGLTPAEIAATANDLLHVAVTRDSVKVYCGRLVKSGQLVRADGKYYLKNTVVDTRRVTVLPDSVNICKDSTYPGNTNGNTPVTTGNSVTGPVTGVTAVTAPVTGSVTGTKSSHINDIQSSVTTIIANTGDALNYANYLAGTPSPAQESPYVEEDYPDWIKWLLEDEAA